MKKKAILLLLTIYSSFLIAQENSFNSDTDTTDSVATINNHPFLYDSELQNEYKARYAKELCNFNQQQIENSADGIFNHYRWHLVGPTGNDLPNEIGRADVIYVSPHNRNHIFIGGSVGGLWKTTNGNSKSPHWQCLTDNLAGGIKDIAVHPDNDNIIYIASSVNAFSPSILDKNNPYTLGVYKTIDGGKTWKLLNTGIEAGHLGYMRRIEMSKNDPNVLYILFSDHEDQLHTGQLYRTTNAGDNWEKQLLPNRVYEVVRDFRQIEVSQNNSSVIYLGGHGGLLKLHNKRPKKGAWKIAENIVDSTEWLDFQLKDGILHCFLVDKNIGSYAQYNIEKKQLTTIATRQYMYNNGCIEIEYCSENNVYMGSVSSYFYNGKMITGINSGRSIHVDVRATTSYRIGDDDILFILTDGGVYRRRNNEKPQNISGNLSLSSFYSVAVSEKDTSLLMGGTHDCGLIRKQENKWDKPMGGDCGTVAIHAEQPSNYLFVCNWRGIRGSIYNSKKQYISSHDMAGYDYSVLQHPDSAGIFYFPTNRKIGERYYIHLSKYNMNTGDTTHFKTINNWGPITAVKISKSSPETIYFAHWYQNSNTKKGNLLYKTTNGKDFEQVFDFQKGAEKRYPFITEIVVHPTNPNLLWVAFGGFSPERKLMRSTDGGNSWIDYSENLPNFPINSLEIDNSTGILFAGTDLGIYYRTVNDNKWRLFGTGLPVTIISDLEINYTSRKLYAATFGRGMFCCQLPGNVPHKDTLVIDRPTIWQLASSFKRNLTIAKGGQLNVYKSVDFISGASIVIEEGGILTIDGGCIYNANIRIKKGGCLELKNKGQLQNTIGGQFILEQGAKLIDNKGLIQYNKY